MTVHHYVFCQSILLRQHESEHAYTVCHSSSVEPDNVQSITSLSAREEPCKKSSALTMFCLSHVYMNCLHGRGFN